MIMYSVKQIGLIAFEKKEMLGFRSFACSLHSCSFRDTPPALLFENIYA